MSELPRILGVLSASVRLPQAVRGQMKRDLDAARHTLESWQGLRTPQHRLSYLQIQSAPTRRPIVVPIPWLLSSASFIIRPGITCPAQLLISIPIPSPRGFEFILSFIWWVCLPSQWISVPPGRSTSLRVPFAGLAYHRLFRFWLASRPPDPVDIRSSSSTSEVILSI